MRRAMKQLRHLAFNVSGCSCMVLFVLTAILWPRSYWVADAVGKTRLLVEGNFVREKGIGVASNEGIFIFSWGGVWRSWDSHQKAESFAVQYGPANSHAFEYAHSPARANWTEYATHEWHEVGFGWIRDDVHSVIQATPDLIVGGTSTRAVAIPHWAIAIVTGVIVVLWGRQRRMNRRYQRSRKGLCIQCGYDLRASLGRCPECGKERALSTTYAM